MFCFFSVKLHLRYFAYVYEYFFCLFLLCSKVQHRFLHSDTTSAFVWCAMRRSIAVQIKSSSKCSVLLTVVSCFRSVYWEKWKRKSNQFCFSTHACNPKMDHTRISGCVKSVHCDTLKPLKRFNDSTNVYLYLCLQHGNCRSAYMSLRSNCCMSTKNEAYLFTLFILFF